MENQNQKDVQVLNATFQNDGESVESRVEFEIQKFNVADAKIAELKDQFKDLQITGVDDKKGIKAITEAISIVRSLRTGVEAKRKDLKNFYLNTGKGIDAEAKRITELLVEIEEPLKAKKQVVDDEIKRIEDEKIKAEQKRLDDRVEELKNAGIVFDGQFYSIGSVSVDIVTIKDLNDESFEELKSRVGIEAGKIAEQNRINDLHETRKSQLLPFWSFMPETLQLAHFGHVEESEFESILDDLSKKKGEFESAQKKQREDAEKLEADKRSFNHERNSFKLEKIGFEAMEDGSFSFKNEAGFHIVKKSEIEVDPDIFTEVFDVAQSKLIELQESEAQKRKDAEIQRQMNQVKEMLESRFASLKNAGLTYFKNSEQFEFEDIKISLNELKVLNETEFTDLLVAIKKRMAEIEHQKHQDAERERLAKLPDLEKIQRYCEELLNVAVPQLSTPEAQEELSALKKAVKLAVENTLSNIKNQK